MCIYRQSLLINNAVFNNVLLPFFQNVNMLVTAVYLHVDFTAFNQLQNWFPTIMVMNFIHDPVRKQILLAVDVFDKLQMNVQHACTVHRNRHLILRHVFFIAKIYFVGVIFKF